MLELIRQTNRRFCQDFVRNPYLCYTEHGQHALYFATLFAAIPDAAKYGSWQAQRVCVLQKEYPTATDLGKSKRQHWDIALLKTPLSSHAAGPRAYDRLRLQAAIEFGMNESESHIEDDINRLAHPHANMDYGFIIHLHRLSDHKSSFSGRDWSHKSHRLVHKEAIPRLIEGKPIEVYFAIVDLTRPNENGAWLITPDGSTTSIPCV
jgi:hypothetical protein